MRFKVTSRQYPKGMSYVIEVEESGVQIASLFKDGNAVAHLLVDGANLVSDLLETGLYQKVIDAVDARKKLKEVHNESKT